MRRVTRGPALRKARLGRNIVVNMLTQVEDSGARWSGDYTVLHDLEIYAGCSGSDSKPTSTPAVYEPECEKGFDHISYHIDISANRYCKCHPT